MFQINKTTKVIFFLAVIQKIFGFWNLIGHKKVNENQFVQIIN